MLKRKKRDKNKKRKKTFLHVWLRTYNNSICATEISRSLPHIIFDAHLKVSKANKNRTLLCYSINHVKSLSNFSIKVAMQTKRIAVYVANSTTRHPSEIGESV